MRAALKFDNILNVRDFGGQSLSTQSGSAISKGKLYRGAQLSKMNARDQMHLQSLGIALVTDLRYRTERARQPSVWSACEKPKTLEFTPKLDQDKAHDMAPHERFVLQELGTAQDARRYMLGSYKERPLKPGFVDMLSRSICYMAQTGCGLYVHCAAGKDRTGTFAAIILLLLGASKDDVMEDYLLTQKAVDLDMIVNMAALKMQKRFERPFDPDALRPFFDTRPDYLQNSLRTIGDIDHYLANIAGLRPMEIANFKDRYTR